MTKTFVQHYVENLLKLLKLLKSAHVRKEGIYLAELRIRYARQGAKAPIKQRSQAPAPAPAPAPERKKNNKNKKKPIDKNKKCGIIKSKKGRCSKMTITTKSYRVEMTNKKTGKKEIRHTLAENEELARHLIWARDDIISQWKINKVEED